MMNIGDKVKINYDKLDNNRGDISKLRLWWGEQERVITGQFTSFKGLLCYTFEGFRGMGFTEDELIKVS